ncbi:MAG: hypothetical protein JSS97_05915 [Actinobacteria bacterium]|nr:hypothetical protein [Actinomycetota bacterium]
MIDVGTNRTEAGLVGDVDFDAVRPIVGRSSARNTPEGSYELPGTASAAILAAWTI